MMDIGTKPHQPDPKYIEPQILTNRVLRFQLKWFQLYPFLHYSPHLKAVLCFDCVRAYVVKNSTFAKNADPAFSTKGYKNWKNAITNFDKHKQSHAHHHAVHVNAQEATPVNVQLSRALEKKQIDARHCLDKITGALHFLAR